MSFNQKSQVRIQISINALWKYPISSNFQTNYLLYSYGTPGHNIRNKIREVKFHENEKKGINEWMNEMRVTLVFKDRSDNIPTNWNLKLFSVVSHSYLLVMYAIIDEKAYILCHINLHLNLLSADIFLKCFNLSPLEWLKKFIKWEKQKSFLVHSSWFICRLVCVLGKEIKKNIE